MNSITIFLYKLLRDDRVKSFFGKVLVIFTDQMNYQEFNVHNQLLLT
jgi:hypothetical protein